ncbi:hypothetical protein HELRODRAFT_191495 [Helobdella robusta]|uniref:Uncharacterized protein n=1 Tax=Helobdella robusta TaxID=6412 RepID=T1FT14_HELRO|nr:hypothetical protein HELRODRAFT_191495 [Helobdella robusta]ESO04880.1 hypothetical protein HELRODRAFT_191495 [Helobdella robusta]
MPQPQKQQDSRSSKAGIRHSRRNRKNANSASAASNIAGINISDNTNTSHVTSNDSNNTNASNNIISDNTNNDNSNNASNNISDNNSDNTNNKTSNNISSNIISGNTSKDSSNNASKNIGDNTSDNTSNTISNNTSKNTNTSDSTSNGNMNNSKNTSDNITNNDITNNDITSNNITNTSNNINDNTSNNTSNLISNNTNINDDTSTNINDSTNNSISNDINEKPNDNITNNSTKKSNVAGVADVAATSPPIYRDINELLALANNYTDDTDSKSHLLSPEQLDQVSSAGIFNVEILQAELLDAETHRDLNVNNLSEYVNEEKQILQQVVLCDTPTSESPLHPLFSPQNGFPQFVDTGLISGARSNRTELSHLERIHPSPRSEIVLESEEGPLDLRCISKDIFQLSVDPETVFLPKYEEGVEEEEEIAIEQTDANKSSVSECLKNFKIRQTKEQELEDEDEKVEVGAESTAAEKKVVAELTLH